MVKLYPIALTLPSFALLWVVAGCSGEPPPQEETSAPRSNAYLEAIQEAEAAKRGADQHNREQQRIDQLIGRGQE